MLRVGNHYKLVASKILSETPHKILTLDIYNDKIKHLLEPDGSLPWSDWINTKHDSRLEGLIKMADLTINLAAICTPVDYNTRSLDTIYSNFIHALPVVRTSVVIFFNGVCMLLYCYVILMCCVGELLFSELKEVNSFLDM